MPDVCIKFSNQQYHAYAEKTPWSVLYPGLEGTYGKVGTSGGKKLDMSKITMGKKDKKKKKR